MDDQQQHPYSAPGPYGPWLYAQPTQATPPPQATPPRRRRGRVFAAFTATALVAGVAGIGAGYAAGHRFGPQGSSTNASSSPQRSSGGTVTIPGNGTWSWSDSGDQSGSGSSGDPFGGTSGDPYSGQTQLGQGTTGQSSDSTATAAGSQLTGLVRITSTMKYAGGKAAGTGMILTSSGEVVTNHHVVEGSTSVKVKVMTTGKTYVAKVVGTDAKDDVAVLQLTGASGLSTVKTDTDGVAVGDKVTAVGDANGTVSSFNAASGKVLALDQHITTQAEATAAAEKLTGLIKISSDVISGDSGGATYDSQGEVVGMTTAASSGGTDTTGYAVPISTVLKVATDLENGTVSSRYDYGSPAFLGIGLGQTGTTVAGVYRGTPAADAGLAAGDKITAIGSTKVTTSTQVHNAVAAYSPGDRTSITWTATDGTSHTKTITLTTGPVE